MNFSKILEQGTKHILLSDTSIELNIELKKDLDIEFGIQRKLTHPQPDYTIKKQKIIKDDANYRSSYASSKIPIIRKPQAFSSVIGDSSDGDKYKYILPKLIYLNIMDRLRYIIKFKCEGKIIVPSIFTDIYKLYFKHFGNNIFRMENLIVSYYNAPFKLYVPSAENGNRHLAMALDTYISYVNKKLMDGSILNYDLDYIAENTMAILRIPHDVIGNFSAIFRYVSHNEVHFINEYISGIVIFKWSNLLPLYLT